MDEIFRGVFLLVVLISVGAQWYLIRRQINHIAARMDAVPAPFKDQIKLSEHTRAAHYTIAKAKTNSADLFIGSVLLLLWTLGGGLQWMDSLWNSFALADIWIGIGFILSVFVLISVLELPLDAYRTFVVEQQFGFNKMTARLFCTDLIKQIALSIVIGVPVLFVVLWLMYEAGALWWLYVWGVWLTFSLFMMWAYPAFIAPLFNRFRPLGDDALRQRIENLLQRNGFHSNGIFVMDGSARSTHGNAYFTGLGANKRIVFFDTLIADLSHDEIEAVLAHELGHFKCGHISKRICMMGLFMLAVLYLLGYVSEASWFYHGLGMQSPSPHAALMLFVMLAPVVGVFLRPLTSYISRQHEFEADDFATAQSKPEDLIQALVKLYRENANTLTPEPLYSIFYDSHPPAPVRIAHLSKQITI